MISSVSIPFSVSVIMYHASKQSYSRNSALLGTKVRGEFVS